MMGHAMMGGSAVLHHETIGPKSLDHMMANRHQGYKIAYIPNDTRMQSPPTTHPTNHPKPSIHVHGWAWPKTRSGNAQNHMVMQDMDSESDSKCASISRIYSATHHLPTDIPFILIKAAMVPSSCRPHPWIQYLDSIKESHLMASKSG